MYFINIINVDHFIVVIVVGAIILTYCICSFVTTRIRTAQNLGNSLAMYKRPSAPEET